MRTLKKKITKKKTVKKDYKNITDVTDIKEAFKFMKLKMPKLSDYNFLPEEERKYNYTPYLLTVGIKALNFIANGHKVWEPNYHTGERKFYPWPTVEASAEKPGGFGFSYSDCSGSYTHSAVGSRLLYIDYNTEQYGFIIYGDLYIENQLIIHH